MHSMRLHIHMMMQTVTTSICSSQEEYFEATYMSTHVTDIRKHLPEMVKLQQVFKEHAGVSQ